MSHKLRTLPRSGVRPAHGIRRRRRRPRRRSIDQILRWAAPAGAINEILDLALIESGKLPLSLEPTSLTEVVRECHAMIEAQALKRDIRMTFPEFDVRYFVKADRTRLKQVLINLLSNAVKYNKVGGSVVVSYTASTAGRIRICVSDTGEGLTPDELKQLFQPFNRLGKESGIEEGTGIGLMVSKQLVELMKGRIGVESTIGWAACSGRAQPGGRRSRAAAGQPGVAALASRAQCARCSMSRTTPPI
jgi:signal transduction histidine kinase